MTKLMAGSGFSLPTERVSLSRRLGCPVLLPCAQGPMRRGIAVIAIL